MGKTLPVLEQSGQYRAEPGNHPAEYVRDITPDQIAGTNIVFINMPLREKATPNTTPEGPLLMATNLRQNYGVNATVIDLNAYRIQDEEAQRRGLENGRHLNDTETRELIEKHCRVHGEPYVVAFSGMITTLGWQKKVARMVKEMLPDSFLVSGGGLATEFRPTPLNPQGLFNPLFLPEIDALAHSEGDEVILKITRDAKIIRERGWRNALQSGELEPYYYGEVGGRPRLRYCGARPKPIVPRSKVLPNFPWADLDLLKTDVFGKPVLNGYINTDAWGDPKTANSSKAHFPMRPKTTSVSTRGCPYTCKYCYREMQGETLWGMRSVEHLVGEMREHIERYGITFKSYPDDNFAVDPGRIKEMIPYFREFAQMGIYWGTHTRLDEAGGFIPKPGSNGREFIFEHPLRVQHMAEAGCRYIGFGPESANKNDLEALGKGGFTLSAGYMPVAVSGEIHWFPKAMVYGIMHSVIFGIHSNCTWIMGAPGSTVDRLKETVLFIKWQEEYYAQHGIPADAVNKNMFALTYYPGTKMANHPRVRQRLSEVFGLTCVKVHPTRDEYEPLHDEYFQGYVSQLDDAVKVLHDPRTGQPLHFSDMTEEEFLQAKEYIDSDQLFRILDM